MGPFAHIDKDEKKMLGKEIILNEYYEYYEAATTEPESEGIKNSMILLLPVTNAGFTLNIAAATNKSDGNPESAKEEVKKLLIPRPYDTLFCNQNRQADQSPRLSAQQVATTSGGDGICTDRRDCDSVSHLCTPKNIYIEFRLVDLFVCKWL